MTVLVVDDNRDTLELLNLLISQQGHEVRTAENKDVALRILGSGYKPSVIFLDHHTPGINSKTFVATVRATLPRTQIVLMSALPDMSAVAAELGVTARLNKPFEFETVNTMLKGFSSGEHAATNYNDPPQSFRA
jgi:CheY-like chemotaxis protein